MKFSEEKRDSIVATAIRPVSDEFQNNVSNNLVYSTQNGAKKDDPLKA